MTNTNQQEQLYREKEIRDKFLYFLKVQTFKSQQNKQFLTDEFIASLEPVEDGKLGGEELPDKIKKIIEEESYKEEIYPKKYGSGSREGYNTMMLYEINSERSECFSKGAEFGYRLAQPSTPVQDGWNEEQIIEAANKCGVHSIDLLIKKLHDSK